MQNISSIRSLELIHNVYCKVNPIEFCTSNAFVLEKVTTLKGLHFPKWVKNCSPNLQQVKKKSSPLQMVPNKNAFLNALDAFRDKTQWWMHCMYAVMCNVGSNADINQCTHCCTHTNASVSIMRTLIHVPIIERIPHYWTHFVFLNTSNTSKNS